MKARGFLAIVVAGLAPLAAVAGCGEKSAPSAATTSATAASSAAAPVEDAGAEAGDEDAALDGSVDADAAEAEAGPKYALFSEEPFPDKRSPLPKASEWESAPQVAIDRGCRECDVRRVREWVRITGPWDGGIVLIGGNADGLVIRQKEIIMPVRRGDRREIELLLSTQVFFKGFDNGHLPTFAGVLSESWPAGEDRPRIVHH
ncbi:MAG: hypothetical protein QM820_35110 [Minicystis sp.]